MCDPIIATAAGRAILGHLSVTKYRGVEQEAESPSRGVGRRAASRARGNRKLNLTTGSLELESVLSELDEKSVKLLDTSLDSALQRTASKRHRSRTSRLLGELKSDLGPRFSFSEDAQSGNLRSKYGRLQKVNESAGTGYVPNDLLRMRKISSSPIRSSPTKSITHTVIIKEETPPPSEDQANEEVKVTQKDIAPSEPKEEAMEAVKDQQVEQMEVASIDTESAFATEAEKVEDAMDLDLQEESVAIVVVVVQEPPGSNPLPLEIKPPSPVVVKLEREEPQSLLLPPPPPPKLTTSLTTTGAPRRVSMRRMTILATPEPPPPPPPPPPAKTPVPIPPTFDCIPAQPLLRGVSISPEFVDHEKYLAVQHLTPGALIWGVLGRYPPWPCMIVEDDKGLFMRQIAGKNLIFRSFVRFFGPKGLNSWINLNHHMPFDATHIAEDLREGTWAGRKGVQGKVFTELQWAIEDAQLVAAEQDWTKRMQVHDSLLLEQHARWRQDQRAAATKRRRSSVASSAQSESAARTSLDGLASSKKRIKLSTPVMDNDTSTHSFSSALSTTSSSGVSTMGKASDTLSVSSASGLGETDEEEKAPAAVVKNNNGPRKGSRRSGVVSLAEDEKAPVEEESVEERLTQILKAIPLDFVEWKREKREELCRNCTKGVAEGELRHCSGSCGGVYHDHCLHSMAVSSDRISAERKVRPRKGKGHKQRHSLAIVFPAAHLEDEGVELECHDDDSMTNDTATTTTPVPHVTGDMDLKSLSLIPKMPQLMQTKQAPRKETLEDAFKCRACTTGEYPDCFICHQRTTTTTGEGENEKDGMTLCSMANCGRAFHLHCLDKWPQSKKRKDGFVCPAHQCHLCISDDPRSQNFKQKSKQKLYKCILCPTSYHLEQNCMPAGTEIVGNLSIICQRHFPLPEQRRTTTTTTTKKDNNNNHHNDSLTIKATAAIATTTDTQTPPPTATTTLPKKKTLPPAALNVNWCFICARGGSLLCCDQCPSAFHSECLNLSEEETRRTKEASEDETFICEECELGRFPLYGELVWAKFGSYRWWPAVIMSEGQVPANLNPSRRSRGEFCVKFLGSNDHAWIGRKRVFLYTDDDALLAVDKDAPPSPKSPPKKKAKKGGSKAATKRVVKKEKKMMEKEAVLSPLQELLQWNGANGAKGKNMEIAFRSSLLEARVLNGMLQERKQVRQLELSKLLRPVPYFKLKTNRPVAPVKLFELRAGAREDLICQCNAEEVCGPNSECLNRLLLTECNPANCAAGERCRNQRLQRREYPELDILRTEGKGWGLVAKEDLREGQLVVEYVGELINNVEMRKRIAVKEREKDDVYYFLTLTKDLIIDAERKGNMARFMNHSCDPNCESQKWTVNGNTRVGLFARKDVKKNTELTFNYHWESTGTTSTACQCGAKKCKGFIGGDPKKS